MSHRTQAISGRRNDSRNPEKGTEARRQNGRTKLEGLMFYVHQNGDLKPAKVENHTFSSKKVLPHAVCTLYGLALDAPDVVDQLRGQHITRRTAVTGTHTNNQHVVGITQR